MKKIYFYLDKKSLPSNGSNIYVFNTYDETNDVIQNQKYDIIHTTSLASLSFDWIKLGYEIHVVRNRKDIIMKPGMDSIGNKDIRMKHNLQRLVMGGYFDEDFK